MADDKPPGELGVPLTEERAIAAVLLRANKSFRRIKQPKHVENRTTGSAQNILKGAYTIVNNMLFTMCLSRALIRGLHKKDHRGRLTDSDTDILRALIAFAGAGLDAALKQLISDAIRPTIMLNKNSKDQFKQFVDSHLASGESVNRSRLRDLLLDMRGSSVALMEAYERELTGDSLQSVDQVNRICQDLGVDDMAIRKRLKPGTLLDQMFKARNAIVHQLDIDEISPTGRATRGLEDARRFAAEALSVTQEIINSVAGQLNTANSP